MATVDNTIIDWNRLPDELLASIFSFLDLSQRIKAVKVCLRWNVLLTNGSSANSLSDVVVLNLFEQEIWKSNVYDTAGSRIKCIPLESADQLNTALQHISSSNSVKFWFKNETFVRKMLELLTERSVRMKCLDVYPYADVVPLELVKEYLPDLSAMTLRPHGTDYFWNGLTLDKFPDFTKMDTLLLDSVNLGESVELPPSLSTLEWTNRREANFRKFEPKLAPLNNLEYLLLGHVDFTGTSVLADFLNTIHVKNMPKLHFVVFRFCKFPSKDQFFDIFSNDDDQVPLAAMKVIKLDLCYGDVLHAARELLAVTTKELKIISLNCIHEDLNISNIWKLIPDLEKRKISLHFALLQKGYKTTPIVTNNAIPTAEEDEADDMSVAKNNAKENHFPPLCLRSVLWKIDMSFLDDSNLLMTLLSAGLYAHLNEMKFVQSAAVTDEFLLTVAKTCPRLRKLSLIHCTEISGAGIKAFISHFHDRLSPHLHITWKHKDHPACFYLQLLGDKQCLQDLKSRFIAKNLPGDTEGEKIVIWDESRKKTLIIQDYGEQEKSRILGFAVFVPSPEQTPSDIPEVENLSLDS